jgi:XTP/dITP diphosphohydrolase
MNILIATTNRGKQKEYTELLADLPWELSFPGPEKDNPDLENGLTFRENAVSKAHHYARMEKVLALADDSGLEVDALGGQPGVFSARFAGHSGPAGKDEANNARLLRELGSLPREKRGAAFRCVICVTDPAGRLLVVEGILRGYINFEPRGDNGFGYDPLFIIPELDQSLAELPPGEKNRISHRGRAVAELKKKWPEFLRTLEERKR